MTFDFYNDIDLLDYSVEDKKIIYGVFFPILDKFFSNPIWNRLMKEEILFKDLGYGWNYSREKIDRYVLKDNGNHYEEVTIEHSFSFNADSKYFTIKYVINENNKRGKILFPMELAKFVYLNSSTANQFKESYLDPWLEENLPGVIFVFANAGTNDYEFI